MPVPSDISQLSTTPASNSPAGSESPNTADDYLRTYAAFIKQTNDTAVAAQTAAGTALTTANTAQTTANAKLNTASPSYTGGLTGDAGLLNLGSGQFVKDVAGQIGVGVTPSTWGGTGRAVQLPSGAISSYGNMTVLQNAFWNDSNWICTSNAPAAYYQQSSGQHVFASAAAAVAGSAITFVPLAQVNLNGQQSSVIPGGTVLYPEYKCRAWANFNGTGTVAIRAGGNVSSITDNGVGDYTLNFSTALPDANYAVSFGCATSTDVFSQVLATGSGSAPTTQTTTQVRITHRDSANNSLDINSQFVSIFR